MNDETKRKVLNEITQDINSSRLSRRGLLNRLKGMGVAFGAAVMLGVTEAPAFSFVLVKLASRCNINCTYCYWFRDPEVYNKPPVLTLDAEDQFCARLEQHRKYELDQFLLVFHGGEPLLFPKYR